MARFVSMRPEEPPPQGLLTPEQAELLARKVLFVSLCVFVAVAVAIESCRGRAEPHTHPHPTLAWTHEPVGSKAGEAS